MRLNTDPFRAQYLLTSVPVQTDADAFRGHGPTTSEDGTQTTRYQNILLVTIVVPSTETINSKPSQTKQSCPFLPGMRVVHQIPFGDYGINSPDSSRENDPGEGGGGEGGGSGTGDEGGPGAHHDTAEEAQSSLFFMAFSAFVSVSPARRRSFLFDVVVVPPRMKRKVVAPLTTGCEKRV